MDNFVYAIIALSIGVFLNIYLLYIEYDKEKKDESRFQEEIELYFTLMEKFGYEYREIKKLSKAHKTLKQIRKANKKIEKAIKNYNL